MKFTLKKLKSFHFSVELNNITSKNLKKLNLMQ